MSITTVSADLQPINNLLPTKQWFDYTPEMNEILNTLEKRIFNLEIALQTNYQISSPKTNIMIPPNQLIPNSMDTLPQRFTHNSLIPDQYSTNVTLENQFDQLNLTPNQMKTRAYEFAAIFENTFDQLNIIYNTLFINDLNRTNNQFQFDDINSNCNPFALNLAGIITIDEREKFRYEIKYFFHILILLFRALLLDSQTDFLTSINNTHNHLSSKELFQLNNRLKDSQEKISKLSFIKKHFHTEKSDQLNLLNSTKSQLTDHLMEEKYRSKVALRYSNDWKQTHIFQWIQMLLQIENTYTKTVHQYENILQQTDLIHQKTVEILIEQNNERKLNADKWYDYYQNESSRFERELRSFQYEFNQLKKQREDMNDEYQRMKRIVDEYNQIKMNEKFLLEKQKQQEEAIKRIQTWWKGTLIRHRKQKRRKKKYLLHK